LARRQVSEAPFAVSDYIGVIVLNAAVDVVMIIEVAAVHVAESVVFEVPEVTETSGPKPVVVEAVVPEPLRTPGVSEAEIPAIVPVVEARAVAPRERPRVVNRPIPPGIIVPRAVYHGRTV